MGGPVPGAAVEPPVDVVGIEDRLVIVRDDLDTWSHVHEVGRRGVADAARAPGREQGSNDYDRRKHEETHGYSLERGKASLVPATGSERDGDISRFSLPCSVRRLSSLRHDRNVGALDRGKRI
jgi:hypothetical protein